MQHSTERLTEPLNCRHLRVTIGRDASNLLINLFISKFDLYQYVFSYEEVGDNHHIHAHLEYNTIPKKTTLSDFFKKQNLTGKYYHKALDKEPINNILYCLKELDIIVHNFPPASYDDFILQTKQINENKSKSSRVKLLDLFKVYITEEVNKATASSLDVVGVDMTSSQQIMELARPGTVVRFIHNVYVDEWDKAPHLSSMKATALYIMQKVTNDPTVPISYENAIQNFYDKFIGLF